MGRQGLSRTRRGVPRWPAAVALLAIAASYIVLSEYVTLGPRVWLPGLVTILVVPLLSAQAWGRYRLARAISLVLLGVVTASVVLRVFFLVSTLPGRGASGLSVLVDSALIWLSNVVTFAVWYWEIDSGALAEHRVDTRAGEDSCSLRTSRAGGRTPAGHRAFWTTSSWPSIPAWHSAPQTRRFSADEPRS